MVNATHGGEHDGGKKRFCYWYADEIAQNVLTFGDESWNFTFWAKVKGSVRIYPRVCKVEDDSNTVYLTNNNQYKGITSGNGIDVIKIEKTVDSIAGESARQFNVGDRLAIEILVSGIGEGEWVEIYYNSSGHPSRVTYPHDTPPYPVPEPSILTLISVGLILFICISGFKRLNDIE
jgi:hypothetical protein